MKKQDIRIYIPFHKSDEDQRMVYGYCTSESLDSHGEIVTKQAIRKAWEAYMEYGNIREMHQPSAVGVTKEYTHDDQGTYIGVKVVDDRAWKFVKEGVYKGFSIGGRVLKKSKNIIEEIVLAEISLVDRPANPDAKYDAVKVDGGLVDQLQLEAAKNNIMKFIEIDGKKFKEDPANPGQPLKGENDQPVEATAEEIAAAEAEAAAAAGTGDGGNAGAGDGGTGGDAGAGDGGSGDGGTGAGAGADGGGTQTEEQKAAAALDLKKKEGQAYLDAHKDTLGTITLAACLDHLDYIRAIFDMNGKDTEGVKKIMEVVKEMIAKEAKEADKGQQTGDLAKILGSELSKAVAPLLEKVGGLETTVNTLKSDVETIKNTKVSPRPQGGAAVEKVIENGAPADTKGIADKRKELEKISEEIEAFTVKMSDALKADPSRSGEFQKQSEALFTKYRNCQRELNDMLSGNGGN